MNDRELATHDYITAILDQAADNVLSHHDALWAIQGSLESFRPRCPSCASVVSYTPWSSGVRAARCGRCSHVWKEAAL
jgi:hypothetical protein